MHIEPGVVDGAKIALSYVTAAGAVGYAAKLALATLKQDGAAALTVRSAFTAALVFCFFQVFPHAPVGVSEVHLILGSTLFLLFGAAPAAIGLALGLLAQGLFFSPADLPQYGMNLTTLLVPLFALAAVARRVIPEGTAYQDVTYRQALSLSVAFQGGVVTWVAFWAIYGQGFSSLAQVGTFAAAYLSVIVIEPVIDLAVLAVAKTMHQLKSSLVCQARLHTPAA
jgi:ABC-type Co2+ transport system permease subunit